MYELWGADFRPPPGLEIIICTDGSTYPDLPSGAGFVFVDDDVKENEYTPKGQHWQIEDSDNFIAELAAINKAIRSVPITANVHIYTDSSASIQAIHKALVGYKGGAPALLNQSGRPYITATYEAIKRRSEWGAYTRISHVYSHTGKRDLPSLGNAMADREAKKGALRSEHGMKHDIVKEDYELPYMITIRDQESMDDEDENYAPAHGNIRRAIQDALVAHQLKEWGTRDFMGATVRAAPKQVLALIKDTWRRPTTAKIHFTLGVLTQKDGAVQWNSATHYECTRCHDLVSHKQSVLHRTLTCAAVADLWNAYEEWAHVYLRAGEWATGATNSTESEITQALRSCPTRQGGTVTALGKKGVPPQEISTTAARHLTRLTLRAAAKTMFREACEHAERAQRAALAAKEVGKGAREFATRTVQAVTSILDLRTRCGMSLNQIREHHLIPGHCVAMIGENQDLWMGEVQDHTTGRAHIKWITIKVVNTEGVPNVRGTWTDWQPTLLNGISTKLIFDLDVPLVWANGTEATMEWARWVDLQERWEMAKVRQAWDLTRPSIRAERGPPTIKKRRKKKPEDMLVPIHAFFHPHETQVTQAPGPVRPASPRPARTMQIGVLHPREQAPSQVETNFIILPFN